MDLLVALRDTSPAYRRKYLPFILNENLLNWLEPSIGDGAISEGGFIYRGSLVKRPEHRTVQLFFNVENTHIDYHPDWPALRELDGLVLIDDADVDVYATQARILNSAVSDIRASIRSDENQELSLDLQAAMRGSAADGLTIVNTSPLRSNVGDSFEDWTLTGELETRLQLSMNISDQAKPPLVNLWAGWSDIDADLGGLNLTVENLGGELQYTTARGFAAESITGTLWGEAISGRVSQPVGDSGPGELDIALTGAVDVKDVREWLDLGVLRLAEGRSIATLHILVPPGKGARLEVESTLAGV